MAVSRVITFVLLPIGISLTILGIAFTIYGRTAIIPGIVKQSLPVSESPLSKTFDNWVNVPLPIYNHFYLFNITNVKELLSGPVTPVVSEIGPFVFLEHRHKVDYKFQNEGNRIRYNQTRTFEFVPSLSLPLDTEIWHLNVPLVSAAAFAHNRGDEFYYYVVRGLYSKTNSTLYPKHTAGELLFDGYEDPILKEGSGIMGIPYDRFGWFYKRNATSTDGVYEMDTGKSDLSKLGRLLSWNDKQSLSYDGTCGSFDGVSAGDLHPPLLYSEPSPEFIKLFVGDICRPVTLRSNGSVSHAGVRGNRFAVDETLFDYSRSENQCYCSFERNSTKCPANGVANVSSCVFDTPAAISLPHFMYADPIYSERVVGFSPDPSIHSFFMDIMPELGAPLAIQAAMQINIVLTRDERLNFTSLAKEEETYYPVFYFITNATISDDLASSIRMLMWTEKSINDIGIGILVTGILVLAFALFKMRKSLPCISEAQEDGDRKQLIVTDPD